jgi:hypothetical protein
MGLRSQEAIALGGFNLGGAGGVTEMKTRLMLALAAVAMVIPVASGIASVTGAVPSKLVGAWTRNVKQADYNKYGLGQQGFLVGVWTMVVKKNGEVDFYLRPLFRAMLLLAAGVVVFGSWLGYEVTGRWPSRRTVAVS